MRFETWHRKLLSEAREIFRLTGNDLSQHSRPTKWVGYNIHVVVRQVVTGTVVTDYTLIDQILGEIIVRYFFGSKDIHFGPQWRKKKFRIFVHHMLDDTYLLKKMAIVDSITKMPSDIRSAIHRLNTLRNGLAHTFFPENRKEYRKGKRLLYLKKDIFTPEGFKAYHEEVSKIIDYLERRRKSTRSRQAKQLRS
jgi:hypothetical protein